MPLRAYGFGTENNDSKRKKQKLAFNELRVACMGRRASVTGLCAPVTGLCVSIACVGRRASVTGLVVRDGTYVGGKYGGRT